MVYFGLLTAPDGPPQDVTLDSNSPQSIKVSWKVNFQMDYLFFLLLLFEIQLFWKEKDK